MGSSGDSAMITGIKHTFCGAAAGAVTKTSTAPLERVKIIMQVHGMKDGGTAERLGIFSTGRVRMHSQPWQQRMPRRSAHKAAPTPAHAHKS